MESKINFRILIGAGEKIKLWIFGKGILGA